MPLLNIPVQERQPQQFNFTNEEHHKIQQEIDRFLVRNIIEVVHETTDCEYVSNIFSRPKSDGRVRIILNLKSFNETFFDKVHFKMETLQSVITAMRQNCYFGSVDIEDAFYTIPIHTDDRKYFRFFFDGIKYQFTALVQGFCRSPLIYTKVLKPVFRQLRLLGHISTVYIDDTCLQGQTFEACHQNITDTVNLLDSLGFTISIRKSVLVPTQQIEFLGFVLCSQTMTVTLTAKKCYKLSQLCAEILSRRRTTIHKLSQVIGTLIAATPGVEHAPLFIRPLEKMKDKQLKKHKGNYKSFLTVTDEMRQCLTWWIENIHTCKKQILLPEPDAIMFTDASNLMWGAFDETHNKRTNGFWSAEEQKLHINLLELKACQIGLFSLFKNASGIYIKLYMDNTTSVSYINRYGGKIEALDIIARSIWFWCLERNITVTACHVSGKMNTTADTLSRSGNEDLEWSLSSDVLAAINRSFPALQVDLFASRLNAKFPMYVSRMPDPHAFAIDAFSFKWQYDTYYAFPPFSIIARVLQKVERDGTELLGLVAPLWPAQTWWPTLIHLIAEPCLLLPDPQKILSLSHQPNKTHPLRKMRLAYFPISGKRSKVKEFQKTLKLSSLTLGDHQQENSTEHILNNGFIFAMGKQIPLIRI